MYFLTKYKLENIKKLKNYQFFYVVFKSNTNV